ncbi:hypothetical protein GCM10009609_17160 [Pseudonocardia aurantiaca]
MSRHWTTPLTDQFGDQLTHQVPDGPAAGTENGVLRAICGRLITPAPLAAPDGKPCPACAAEVTPPSPQQPYRRAVQLGFRPGSRWLRALFAR